MPRINLNNVSLEYPIYDLENRSLRRSVTSALSVGGQIKSEKGGGTSILALDRITLSLNKGDRVAVLGHNGAGKTTLLKVLAGFYEPSSGTMSCQGKVSALLSLMAGMDLNLNGHENILLCGMLYGLSKKEALEQSKDIAEFSELGPYLDMPVRLLSSGMVLRLAFSICTSINCEILLLDEWVGAGDKSFKKKTRKRLSEMVLRSVIMVFATHDPEMAFEFCNKAIYLEHGKVLMFGGIEDVLTQYYA